MFDQNAFPNLTPSNHEKTSEFDVGYNCIAWAAQDTEHWWQPGFHWPVESSRDEHGVGELINAFASVGYAECENGELIPGVDKVVLYGSAMMYTHAARQLPDGNGPVSSVRARTSPTIPRRCGWRGVW